MKQIERSGIKSNAGHVSKPVELSFDSKVLLGVIIPVLAILGLIIVSNVGTLTVKKETLSSVKISSLIYDTSNYNAPRPAPVNVQTWTITNNFILPKKYELPKLVACLDGRVSTYDTYEPSLSVFYVPLDEKVAPDTSSYIPIVYDFGLTSAENRYYSYYGYKSIGSIDVPPKSAKTVKVFVSSGGVYKLNNQKADAYKDVINLALYDVSDKGGYSRDCNYRALETSAAAKVKLD